MTSTGAISSTCKACSRGGKCTTATTRACACTLIVEEQASISSVLFHVPLLRNMVIDSITPKLQVQFSESVHWQASVSSKGSKPESVDPAIYRSLLIVVALKSAAFGN